MYALSTHLDEGVGLDDDSGDMDTRRDLHSYLETVMSGFAAPGPALTDRGEAGAVAAALVDLLCSRPFSYLSRTRARVYENAIRSAVICSVEREAPIPFFLDIGGGYHATIHPGEEDFSFDVGLGELLVLAQIARFRREVAKVYAPGILFSLVIDNLCALLVNDIAAPQTLAYCGQLRRLIEAVQFSDIVSVLVESEHFSAADLAKAARDEAPARLEPMTDKRRRNVERFLGRPCSDEEALEREERYYAIVNASERMLSRYISGIHMTQRATASTMCFRPFPGGDSRIQSGQVVMTRNPDATLRPMLLTSANASSHACSVYRFAGLLPPQIDHVIFAQPRKSAAAAPGSPQGLGAAD